MTFQSGLEIVFDLLGIFYVVAIIVILCLSVSAICDWFDDDLGDLFDDDHGKDGDK